MVIPRKNRGGAPMRSRDTGGVTGESIKYIRVLHYRNPLFTGSINWRDLSITLLAEDTRSFGDNEIRKVKRGGTSGTSRALNFTKCIAFTEHFYSFIHFFLSLLFFNNRVLRS